MSGRFRPLVLCYHRVSTTEPRRLAVSPDALEAHLLSLLRRGYRPGAAADVVDGVGRVVHATFDDAFRSVHAAVPALERTGVRATVFACAGFADDGRPLDVPELRSVVAQARQEFETMRWDELRALSERGIEIGSHTVSHPHLPSLSDAELDRELIDSRAEIEDELALPCRYLAYPYGDEDGRVRAAARRAGYDAAFALPGRREPVDRFALPRVDLYWRDTGPRARAKLSPAFWLVARVRERAAAVARPRR